MSSSCSRPGGASDVVVMRGLLSLRGSGGYGDARSAAGGGHHLVGVIRRLQHPPPSGQEVVDGGGADERLVGNGQRRRRQDERARLRAAETAVEGDQLLEGAPLAERRVVEAADQDVGAVGEGVRAPQVLLRRRR